MTTHAFKLDAKSGLQICERCGKAKMRSTPETCSVITIPPLTQDQRAYLEPLLKPQPVDLSVVVGGPRKPARAVPKENEQ